MSSIIISKNGQFKVDFTSLIADRGVVASEFECHHLTQFKRYINGESYAAKHIIPILHTLQLQDQLLEVGNAYVAQLTGGICIPRRILEVMVTIPELRIQLVLMRCVNNSDLPPIRRRVTIPDHLLSKYRSRTSTMTYLLRIGCDVRQVCRWPGEIRDILRYASDLDSEVVVEMLTILNEYMDNNCLKYDTVDYAIKLMRGLVPAYILDELIPSFSMHLYEAIRHYLHCNDVDSIRYIIDHHRLDAFHRQMIDSSGILNPIS